MRNIKTVIEASKGAKTLYIMGIMLIVWKEPFAWPFCCAWRIKHHVILKRPL